MENILPNLIIIPILAVLILIHELGHFFMAKKHGVKVEEFGFGLPPRLWGFKKGETIYSINWLPIGGFVKVYGEEYHEEAGAKDKKLKDRAFVYKKPWQKVSILVAGVIMNFLLGWVIMSALFTQGVNVPRGVRVEQVVKGSPAQQAGLQPKDVILDVKKGDKVSQIKLYTDLNALTKKYGGEQVTLVVKRGERMVDLQVTPRKNPGENQGALGAVIGQSSVLEKIPWYMAPVRALQYAYDIIRITISELGRIIFSAISLKDPKAEFTGPIGIARIAAETVKFGIQPLLELVALLSINLAIFNILPIPALDGGRLVFVLYEWITGKRSNAVLERYMNMVGLFILLLLTALISIRDIQNFGR